MAAAEHCGNHPGDHGGDQPGRGTHPGRDTETERQWQRHDTDGHPGEQIPPPGAG